MNLTPAFPLLRRWANQGSVQRSDPYMPDIAFQQWVDELVQFGFQGSTYTAAGAKQEESTGQFQSLVHTAYKTNGVVFACMLVRMLLFSEARFQYRLLSSGRPGKLFGNTDLYPLEHPWPGATTGDLLSRALQHADLAGNAYMVKRPGPQIRLLRPDWVSILVGSDQDSDIAAWDADAQVLGYVYEPGGKNSGRPAKFYAADEVAHFAPIPDPEAQFRGMSWITPIVREVMADKAATQHKLTFFENGATVNLLVKFDIDSVEKMRPWIEAFKEGHAGSANAYKTLFLGAGTDATPVGANLEQIQFKVTQGAGETRIAAAAGVPPVIVGLSEGLQAATYSNYGQARRRFADGTMRPLWRNMAGSLARIVNVPPGAELWYDDRDISFLREDEKDNAEVLSLKATAMNALVAAGYSPESVVAAVEAGDLNQLAHSGLVSVQLQKPGAPSQPALNGANGNRQLSIEELHRYVTEREG